MQEGTTSKPRTANSRPSSGRCDSLSTNLVFRLDLAQDHQRRSYNHTARAMSATYKVHIGSGDPRVAALLLRNKRDQVWACLFCTVSSSLVIGIAQGFGRVLVPYRQVKLNPWRALSLPLEISMT
jgi:hypothetical protein